MDFRQFVRWSMGCVLLLLLSGGVSWGQGSASVHVSIPEVDLNLRLSGSLAKANFELQGVVPIASSLSFPTAIACAPGGGLYVAEFALHSGGDVEPNDVPETRIVRYATDGNRGDIVARVPTAFVIGMTINDAGELFMGTGVFPGKTEFTGIWRVNPTGNSEATQIVKPSDLQELLDLLESVINPRDPEVRQLAFIPNTPSGRPFAGHLLFTAGAGTQKNWYLYRSSVLGSSVGKPEKVDVGFPWHAVASGSGGDIFLGNYLEGEIIRLSQDLQGTEPFAELVQPFQLAVDAGGTLYVTTQEFDFTPLPASGKKPATLWRLDRFGRLPVGAAGAWGVAACQS